MIQRHLAGLVTDALRSAMKDGALPTFEVPAVEMERPKSSGHGDWATGIAMVCARQAGKPPREIAQLIANALGDHHELRSVEVAGPGFLNFTLSNHWLQDIVRQAMASKDRWGRSEPEEPMKLQVEFVSANPTGALHVGHGRWAVVGDTLARLLEWAGFEVEREFYVNDHGVQMRKFAESLQARYQELQGIPGEIPEGGYNGLDIVEVAQEILDEGIPLPESPDAQLEFFRSEGLKRMLEHQRKTLSGMDVEFDVWFSESQLHEAGSVGKVVQVLRDLGHVYEAEGASWLRTTDFGDDKDRVLVRSIDGMPSYLAADLAYFLHKVLRGFERMIYLVGADHHGWKRQMQAAIRALGEDPEHCEFLLGQLVQLERSGEPVKMSKRTGETIRFDELLEEVGQDATRYHFLRTSVDQSVRFDLDVVVQQSQENPVFYVQYAHARICAILRLAEENGVQRLPVEDVVLAELQHDSELDLMRKIAEFPEAVEVAARLRAPHRITRYVEELAATFHAFYRDCRVVGDDPTLTQARLALCDAARLTLRNALRVCGVSAPERM